MGKSPAPSVEEMLVKLYTGGRPFLEDYPWEWEDDRWYEFLCCLLVAQVGDGERVRQAVQTARSLDLLDLASTVDRGTSDHHLLIEVFRRHGFDTETSSSLAESIAAVARVVRRKWGGHLQRFLRKHGNRLAKELAGELSSAGIHRAVALKASVLWLQNVANLPILDTQDQHIARFRESIGVTTAELLRAADRVGVNVSVLDDLLAIEAAASAELDEESRRRRVTKT